MTIKADLEYFARGARPAVRGIFTRFDGACFVASDKDEIERFRDRLAVSFGPQNIGPLSEIPPSALENNKKCVLFLNAQRFRDAPTKIEDTCAFGFCLRNCGSDEWGELKKHLQENTDNEDRELRGIMYRDEKAFIVGFDKYEVETWQEFLSDIFGAENVGPMIAIPKEFAANNSLCVRHFLENAPDREASREDAVMRWLRSQLNGKDGPGI